MDYKSSADDILRLVGGKGNVSHIAHCSTRLRLTLVDDKKADYVSLEKVPGVIGVRKNAQCQIIIGNDVIEFFNEIMKLIGQPIGVEDDTLERKLSTRILDFVVSIFQPLVPAVSGGGILKSLLLLFISLGWMTKGSTIHLILDAIGTAPMYLLPILVAITTANKLKVNPIVAVSAVGALLLPNMTKILADGAIVFQFTLKNITYAYQIFPAILTVLFYAQLEGRVTKISPKPIRIFFVPLVCLAITVPVALLILGPLGYTLGTWMTTGILLIFSKLGFIAMGILAAILPFMIATGMHKAMLPYAVNAMSLFGKEILYLPASLAHNMAECGASLAVAIKTKDTNLRATAISAAISACFGITEPAIYGVTLLHKSVLYSVMIGGAVGGVFIGCVAIEGFALVGPGIASLSMFVSPTNPMNLMYALAAIPVTIIATFVAVLLLWKEQPQELSIDYPLSTEGSNELKSFPFKSPALGKVISLSEVNDDVFSSKLIGDGIAIIPEGDVLYASTDGVINSVYKTGHAINMVTNEGVELVYHIGIDTVKLNGEFFTPLVKDGDYVIEGQQLIRFDRDKIEMAGYDCVVLCIVSNSNKFKVNSTSLSLNVDQNDIVMLVEGVAQ